MKNMTRKKLNIIILIYFFIYLAVSIIQGFIIKNLTSCQLSSSVLNCCGSSLAFFMSLHKLVMNGAWAIPLGIILYFIGIYLVEHKNN